MTRGIALVVLVAALASVQLPPASTARARQSGAGAGTAPADLRLNALGMRFVEIPAGSFDMGSRIGPGEQPVHRVTVSGFWMGVTEVTQRRTRAARRIRWA